MPRRPVLILGLLLTATAAQATTKTVQCTGTFSTNCSSVGTSYCMVLDVSISDNTLLNKKAQVVAQNSTRTVSGGDSVTSVVQVNGQDAVRTVVPVAASIYNDPRNPDYKVESCVVTW